MSPIASRSAMSRRRALVAAASLGLVVGSLTDGLAAETVSAGSSTGSGRQAHRRGVSRETFDRALRRRRAGRGGARQRPSGSPSSSSRSPFTSRSAVSASRIETGQARAKDWKATLEKADPRLRRRSLHRARRLGAGRTNFGKNPGDLSTIRCLATLAYARYPRRLFPPRAARRARHPPAGPHQRPRHAGVPGRARWARRSSCHRPFKRYAIDYEGSGRKDIWRSVPTALGSTAFYLRKHGWIPGETWGYEVAVPAGGLGVSAAPHPFTAWAARGRAARRRRSHARSRRATLLVPAGAGGPHSW